MIIATYAKGNRTLELHYNEYHQLDDDGRPMIDFNWVCKISDGREMTFAYSTMAMIYLKHNMWKLC